MPPDHGSLWCYQSKRPKHNTPQPAGLKYSTPSPVIGLAGLLGLLGLVEKLRPRTDGGSSSCPACPSSPPARSRATTSPMGTAAAVESGASVVVTEPDVGAPNQRAGAEG